ncbi:MAG: hypothetical protein U0934_09565 [Pseudotabrizicola sp.]|uniref:hypothetical protein n=1 Tax=Pseudotabrizicola sp. TaxID=2939647 RepID=UPI0027289513|nr:hypothetical protein [Pseudotabrizicola sp.]MDO8882359.1 hypothetical protein [Pseudotabrizicola sp.]MDP2082437.1 hypothetical protein [Pseudotabrizicola sp.]MDZ7574190.1 hypothetical protein [Pseudotabrizicola sp.]
MRNGMLALVIAALAGGAWWLWQGRLAKPLTADALATRLAVPLAAPEGPLAVYHLGHSLVGRDMPALLAQMAGHDHASQLGWGSSLKDHWHDEVAGFETENAHARHRPAGQALDSGDYQVVVLTEMVEIRDAIRYHDSAQHLALWAQRARKARPDVRLYLYETWHRTDDSEGWLARIDADSARYWQGDVLAGAMAQEGVGAIYVIPGGPVMAAVVRAIDAGQVPGLTTRDDLFASDEVGAVDSIHFNDAGAYLMALTHYAVIYQRNPKGLPHNLTRADGAPITALSEDTARALQRIVWDTVFRYGLTGMSNG